MPMKYRGIFKERLGCSNSDEVFNYLIGNLKETITNWDYFVNWAKVLSNLREVEIDLNILNYLIGKQNVAPENNLHGNCITRNDGKNDHKNRLGLVAIKRKTIIVIKKSSTGPKIPVPCFFASMQQAAKTQIIKNNVKKLNETHSPENTDKTEMKLTSRLRCPLASASVRTSPRSSKSGHT